MRRAVIAVILLGCATAGWAGYTRTAVPAKVSWRGSGPGGFKIEGKTDKLLVAESETAITITVPFKDMTTGIALRDTHMRDKYLEVAKFPDTKLVVGKDALAAFIANPAAEAKLKGTYTLHGVEKKDMPFTAKGSCSGDVCDIVGTLPININEFGIIIPKYLGVTMKPDVVVDVAFQVKK